MSKTEQEGACQYCAGGPCLWSRHCSEMASEYRPGWQHDPHCAGCGLGLRMSFYTTYRDESLCAGCSSMAHPVRRADIWQDFMAATRRIEAAARA